MKKHLMTYCVLVLLLMSCDNNTGILNNSNLSEDWQMNPYTPENAYFRKLFFIDQKTGWMVGSGGYIFKTDNGGDSWVQQNGKTTKKLVSLFFINENQGWIAGYNNTLLHTTDGGKNWHQVTVYQDDTKLNTDIYFADDKIGWFINNYGEIYKTTDGGNSWQKIYVLPYLGWAKIKFLDNLFGYVTRLDGSVLMKTTDGGQSWEEIRLLIPNAEHSIMARDLEMIDKTIGYYTYSWCSGGEFSTASPIMKTNDGGYTWTLQDSIMNPYLKYLHFFNGKDGCIAGANYIYSTSDSGQTWNCTTTFNESDYITDIFFYDKSHGWALCKTGDVYKIVY